MSVSDSAEERGAIFAAGDASFGEKPYVFLAESRGKKKWIHLRHFQGNEKKKKKADGDVEMHRWV